jgi:hypothetical protein
MTFSKTIWKPLYNNGNLLQFDINVLQWGIWGKILSWKSNKKLDFQRFFVKILKNY